MPDLRVDTDAITRSKETFSDIRARLEAAVAGFDSVSGASVSGTAVPDPVASGAGGVGRCAGRGLSGRAGGSAVWARRGAEWAAPSIATTESGAAVSAISASGISLVVTALAQSLAIPAMTLAASAQQGNAASGAALPLAITYSGNSARHRPAAWSS